MIELYNYDCKYYLFTGKTALIWSIQERRKAITQMLIEAGANTDVQDKNGIYLVINNNSVYVYCRNNYYEGYYTYILS